eukprot:TRINITY_DN6467_c0_g1_i1.p1 TRINITY_DN6467_c0_g1~~TRINITY_DN6467_c0_g1_i1.p1  ORF type:complete len:288 (-),score=45.98 TRINITY_DN6467_c0_g1_i1:64-927(-)
MHHHVLLPQIDQLRISKFSRKIVDCTFHEYDSLASKSDDYWNFNITFAGPARAGKTSLINQLRYYNSDHTTSNSSNNNNNNSQSSSSASSPLSLSLKYKSTEDIINVGCIHFDFVTDSFRFNFTDTPGKNTPTGAFIVTGTHVYVYVYDIADRQSYHDLLKLYLPPPSSILGQDYDDEGDDEDAEDSQYNGSIGIVVGTHLDLHATRQVPFDEMYHYCNILGLPYLEVSNLPSSGRGIAHLLITLADKIKTSPPLRDKRGRAQHDNDDDDDDDKDTQKKSKKKCNIM